MSHCTSSARTEEGIAENEVLPPSPRAVNVSLAPSPGHRAAAVAELAAVEMPLCCPWLSPRQRPQSRATAAARSRPGLPTPLFREGLCSPDEPPTAEQQNA